MRQQKMEEANLKRKLITEKLKELRIDLPSFKDEKSKKAMDDLKRKDRHLKELKDKQLKVAKKMAGYANVVKEMHRPKISSAKQNELAIRIEQIKKKEDFEVKTKAKDDRQ